MQNEQKLLESDTRARLWAYWLWDVDLKEVYCNDIQVNEAHLVGLLLCRDMGAQMDPAHSTLLALEIPSIPTTLTLGPRQRIGEMSTNTLIQSIESLQVGWVKALYAPEEEADDDAWVAVERLTILLFQRLGTLCMTNSTNAKLFDHLPSIEVIHDNMLGINIQTIRRLMDVFVILFRHIDLRKRSSPPPCQDTAAISEDTMLPPAIEATKDEFYNVSMHFEVSPGARLSYIHAFPGMYNCVSQVVFYNNESYERRQHNKYFEAIDVLPMLLHMYPEIKLILEEDRTPPDTEVYWMMVSGRIYLMVHGQPLFHRDIFLAFLARHACNLGSPPPAIPPCPSRNASSRTCSR